MKNLCVLFLFIRSICGETYFLSNETLHKRNEMKYSHESSVIGDEAEFRFTIFNTTYAREELGIDSYYYSVTFLGDEPREEQIPVGLIVINETIFHGVLKMENLEEEGNYFICVIFLNQSDIISSSRFCHVVSVSGQCNLEFTEKTFNNRHVFILLGFVGVLLLIIVIFSMIHRYISRPRTIEDHMKLFPQSHNENLEVLAVVADERRRRQTQPALGERLREQSVLTIDYNPNTDDDYHNYHKIDNVSLNTVTE